MKPLLMMLTMTLLGVCVNACGGAGDGSNSISSELRGRAATATIPIPAPQGHVVGDDDEDDDAYNHYDDDIVRHYGHQASASERQAITAIVKHYFMAVNAADGATACSLLYPGLAKSTDLSKAVPPDYTPSPPSNGKSCAQFMSALFTHARRQLALADIPSVQVLSVRVRGARALAILGFKTAPEREIALRREGGAWKINGLLDELVP